MKTGRNTHSGKYIVENKDKYIGKNLHNITYRSSWELSIFKACDNHPNIISWGSEILSIKYRHPSGQIKSYVPDLYVVYQNEQGATKSEIIEIKPLCQSDPKYCKSDYDKEQYLINQAKWAAAREYCSRFGITFRVITEVNIFRNTKFNSKSAPKRRKK